MDKINPLVIASHSEQDKDSSLTDHLKRAMPQTDSLPAEGEIEGFGKQKKIDGCFTMVSGCVRKDN